MSTIPSSGRAAGPYGRAPSVSPAGAVAEVRDHAAFDHRPEKAGGAGGRCVLAGEGRDHLAEVRKGAAFDQGVEQGGFVGLERAEVGDELRAPDRPGDGLGGGHDLEIAGHDLGAALPGLRHLEREPQAAQRG